MYQQLDKYRVSPGSNSYAEVPIREVFQHNGADYQCVEYPITPNVYGVDRCNYCSLEHTDVCKRLKCTDRRSDGCWVYFIKVDCNPIPTHNTTNVPIKRVIIK